MTLSVVKGTGNQGNPSCTSVLSSSIAAGQVIVAFVITINSLTFG